MQKALTAYCKDSSQTPAVPAVKPKQLKIKSNPSVTPLKIAIEANKKSLREFCKGRIKT